MMGSFMSRLTPPRIQPLPPEAPSLLFCFFSGACFPGLVPFLRAISCLNPHSGRPSVSGRSGFAMTGRVSLRRGGRWILLRVGLGSGSGARPSAFLINSARSCERLLAYLLSTISGAIFAIVVRSGFETNLARSGMRK